MTGQELEEFLTQFRLKHNLDKKLREIEEIKFYLESLELDKINLEKTVYEALKQELQTKLNQRESHPDVMIYKQFANRRKD